MKLTSAWTEKEEEMLASVYRWIYRRVGAQRFYNDLLPVFTFLYRWKDLDDPYKMAATVFWLVNSFSRN